MTASKKKPKDTKCSDHLTLSLITHTAKMVARIEGVLKGKLRMYLEKISLDLEEKKELRNEECILSGKCSTVSGNYCLNLNYVRQSYKASQ
jgi:hypothetical protein